MLRSSGFKVCKRIAHECYQCEPVAGDPEITPMIEEELLAATGQGPRP
jgi:hypothetical protein